MAGAEVAHVSAVTAWEIAVKAARGRLTLARPAPEWVPLQIRLGGFRSLAVSVAHALEVHELPEHHRDPFDRLLVAQARVEGLALVSADPALGRYDVRVVW